MPGPRVLFGRETCFLAVRVYWTWTNEEYFQYGQHLLERWSCDRRVLAPLFPHSDSFVGREVRSPENSAERF